MRINKVPAKRGYWKMMRPMGVEAQWMIRLVNTNSILLIQKK